MTTRMLSKWISITGFLRPKPPIMSTTASIENIDYWRHPSLSGIELSQAEFTHFSFDKHVHLDYHLGVVTQGAQQFVNKGSYYQLGQHSLSTLNPDDTHDGQSRDAEGYRVKVMSIPVEYMNEVSQELGLKEHFLVRLWWTMRYFITILSTYMSFLFKVKLPRLRVSLTCLISFSYSLDAILAAYSSAIHRRVYRHYNWA